MLNRYAGSCRCGQRVAAKAGEAKKEGGRWQVYCRDCLRAQERPDEMEQCPGCESCDGEGGLLVDCRAQAERIYGLGA